MSVKLLIVDDRKENIFALSSLLEELNVQIFKCQSGVEALNMMLDHEFALALIDVQMPDMNGFELAELIRGTERTKNVPIIFVTAAKENSGFTFKGYESGAVDFLYKPVDTVILKSKVQVFIELGTQKRLLKEQVEELRAAKDIAERANQLKSSFLANMSHEIRTPLGALIGFTDLLRDDNLDRPTRLEYLDIIERNGQILVRLIDDILDLSKVEAGHLEIEDLEVSPLDTAQEVLSLLHEKAAKKEIFLKFESSSNVPAKIVCDPMRLRQILTNIIGNAIKFTEKGGVTVRADVQPGKDGADSMTFYIEDTGIGMDESQAARLFQPFVQADNTMSRRFGGTGLGLILSKRLANLMGGDLKIVKSAANIGSVFEIQIAMRPNAKARQQPFGALILPKTPVEKKQALLGRKILVVEDSADNQLLVKSILHESGASVDCAKDGQEGVEKALEGNYDVVLMDIQMPVLNGYEAVEKLRSQTYRKPIIALTANAMRGELEKFAKIGFDEYLTKPLKQNELLDKVIYYSNLSRRSPATS